MYYSNLAISVLVVCTYAAIMSQPMNVGSFIARGCLFCHESNNGVPMAS